jgi:hypothetical protein
MRRRLPPGSGRRSTTSRWGSTRAARRRGRRRPRWRGTYHGAAHARTNARARRTLARTCAHALTRTLTRMHARTHAHTHLHTHTLTHTHTSARAHTHPPTHTHSQVQARSRERLGACDGQPWLAVRARRSREVGHRGRPVVLTCGRARLSRGPRQLSGIARARARSLARERTHARARSVTHRNTRARTHTHARARAHTYTRTQVCFLNGDGVAVDHAKAAELCVRAAKAGNTAAQLLLGLMQEEGVGTDPDPAAAVTWYKLAAHHGVRAAQFNLGSCYADGRGVERNDEVCARAQVRARVCGVRAVRLRRRHVDGSRQQDKPPKRPSVRSSHAGVGGRRGSVVRPTDRRALARPATRVLHGRHSAVRHDAFDPGQPQVSYGLVGARYGSRRASPTAGYCFLAHRGARRSEHCLFRNKTISHTCRSWPIGGPF